MLTVYIILVVLLGIIIISTDSAKEDCLESSINTFLENDNRIKRCNI